MVIYDFSPAQKLVADLLLQGMSNKEIADKLCVCEKTVKFHVTAILKLVGVDSRHRYIARHYMDLLKIVINSTNVVTSADIEKKIGTDEHSIPELPR